MSTNESTGRGLVARLRRFAIVSVIVALAGALVVLLSERNSRAYYLAAEGGALVVSRGARLPWGKVSWTPEEPALAGAYARIPLPAGVGDVPEQRFDERQDLDRALFELLAAWADTRIRTDDPVQVREGLGFVERAAQLPGIDGDQRRRLRAMQAELAWFEGRERLERGTRLLEEARGHLRLATEASPARAREATAILYALEPALEQAHRALQTARGVRPAVLPADTTPPETKAPAPAAEAAPAAARETAPAAEAEAAAEPAAEPVP